MSFSEIEAALEHGIDIRGRRVFLHGDVSEDSIARAIRGLYILSEMDTTPIELFVSSYGGDLDEAFALHDVTRTIRPKVHTVALGKCMSAAPLLVACGEPGSRWVAENALFMLHDVELSELDGSPAQVAAHLEVTKLQMRKLAKLLGKYTKKRSAHWLGIFRSKIDRFFDAAQAVEWGLVDQVWSEKD